VNSKKQFGNWTYLAGLDLYFMKKRFVVARFGGTFRNRFIEIAELAARNLSLEII
jgi:hypothetical protein